MVGGQEGCELTQRFAALQIDLSYTQEYLLHPLLLNPILFLFDDGAEASGRC